MTRLVVRVSAEDPSTETRALVTVTCEDDPDASLATGLIPKDLPQLPAAVVSLLGAAADGDPLAALCAALDPTTIRTKAGYKAVGNYLFGVLLGSLSPGWAELITEANPAEVVLDVQDPGLASVPWELMAQDSNRLFFDSGRGLYRRPERRSEGEPVATPTCGPLRVLVVVGDPMDPMLSYEREMSALYATFAGKTPDMHGLIHPELLLAPSLNELAIVTRELQPHVLHVVAHGVKTADGPGIFIKAIHGWSLSVEDVANLLTPSPPLVVLNTCHGASPTDRAAQWGFAAAFHSIGARAVVAMQGEIQSIASVAFSRAFYGAVASGRPIDVAVREARMAIAAEVPGSDADWALPVLTLKGEPSAVLPDLTRAPSLDGFERVRRAVDRDVERRQLCTAVQADDTVPHPLRVVVGKKEVGKTFLLLSCLLTCARRGRRVRYLKLAGGDHVDWLSLVRVIADGTSDEQDAFDGPMPSEPRLRLHHQIESLRQGREPGELANDDIAELPGDGPFVARTEWASGYIDRIFGSLRAALAKEAEANGLVLALDGLSDILGADLQQYVWPLLLKPIDGGKVPGVQLVASCRQVTWKRLPEEIQSRVDPIQLKDFEESDAQRLTMEYCARCSHDVEAWNEAVDLLFKSGIISGKFPPRTFKAIETLFDQVQN